MEYSTPRVSPEPSVGEYLALAPPGGASNGPLEPFHVALAPKIRRYGQEFFGAGRVCRDFIPLLRRSGYFHKILLYVSLGGCADEPAINFGSHSLKNLKPLHSTPIGKRGTFCGSQRLKDEPCHPEGSTLRCPGFRASKKDYTPQHHQRIPSRVGTSAGGTALITMGQLPPLSRSESARTTLI